MSILEHIDSDQLDLVLLLLLLYPMCFILTFLKKPEAKMMYNLLAGFLLLVYFYGKETIYLLIAPFLSFISIFLFSEKTNCVVTLIISFSCLSICHYQRLFWESSGSWKIDINIPMMISTLKISSIPFIILDGYKFNKSNNNNKDKDSDCTLNPSQLKYLIKQKPTFLEYFSYLVFLPTAIIGPYFEYKIYYNYIYQIEDFDSTKLSSDQKEKVIRNQNKTVINRTVKALIYIILYVLCQKYFDYRIFFELREFKFLEFLSVVFAYTLKFRYIIGWMFSEAHLAVCGVSFNKEDLNFEGIKIVNDEEVVLYSNPCTIFKNWNITVHQYLKRYIYTRIPKKNPILKQLSFVLVFIFSAIWHGFYPSYYIVFFHFPFMILMYENIFFISSLNIIKIPALVKTVIYRISTIFLMDMTAMIFSSLEVDKAYMIMRNTYYSYSIFIFVGFLATSLLSKYLKIKYNISKGKKTINIGDNNAKNNTEKACNSNCSSDSTNNNTINSNDMKLD